MRNGDHHILTLDEMPSHSMPLYNNKSLDNSSVAHILLSKIPTNVLEAELSKRHDREWCKKCFAHRTLHAHKAEGTVGSHMYEMQAISIIICEGCNRECDDCTCKPLHT